MGWRKHGFVLLHMYGSLNMYAKQSSKYECVFAVGSRDLISKLQNLNGQKEVLITEVCCEYCVGMSFSLVG
jgi:hypothetical protein